MVAVTDPLEHLINYPIYKPLMDRIKRMDAVERPIKIGICKNSDEWIRFGQKLERYDYVLTVDLS